MQAESQQAGAKRGRGRPKLLQDEELAVQIARRSRNIFLERGYARTRMEDIVSALQISKSTLYRLFPNKKELFSAIIDDHRHEMLALPGDYGDIPLEDALARIFLVDLDEEANHDRMAFIHFVVFESRGFPELQDLLHERGAEHTRRTLAGWLDVQKEAGRIDISNGDDAAKALMDMMFGALVAKPNDFRAAMPHDERVRYLRACIRMFVRGIQPKA